MTMHETAANYQGDIPQTIAQPVEPEHRWARLQHGASLIRVLIEKAHA
jgi:hypothetical protein